jgi:integrase
MPIQKIRSALQAFNSRPVPAKVRSDYGGGASQFDAIAVEVLAVLGMRPRELIQARSDALVIKTDVFDKQGLFLRLVDGKNKASERDIPLSDGVREVLPVQRLREMLEWQGKNARSLHGAVSSFGTRFKKMTGGSTLYQMRHSWKDVAVQAEIDSELRERLMGHKVPGVSTVYGSGIPLARGLDALILIRDIILSEKR